MTEKRIERDSLGEVEVNADALYRAQTQRAIDNFPISGKSMPASFVRAVLHIKAAAAAANVELEQLAPSTGEAIIKVVEDLLSDADLMTHFPVDIFQTGSGTSTNMNANEVVATLATRHLGEEVGPNDHVN
ncbi:MAG: lyase family protein, partial [Pseudomonadota bacterium]